MERYYFELKESQKANDIIRDVNDAFQKDVVKELTIIQVYDVATKGEFKDNLSLYNPLLEKKLTNLDLTNKKHIWFRSVNGQFNQNEFNKKRIIEALGYENVEVNYSMIYVFDDNVDVNMVQSYLINDLEYEVFDGSARKEVINTDMSVEIIADFINLNEEQLKEFLKERSLSMNTADLSHIQNYFISIKRNPTITEILMLDTYWSDHCRHTTFETALIDIDYSKSSIKDEIEDALNIYNDLRVKTNRLEKPQTLMDMASIEARYEKQIGLLDDLEESEEVNACSIEIDVDVDGIMERWLLMYKNETHNHPTEIEPYGGASTCVGGAIRDPLSGRAYVYQGMRITGAGDVRKSLDKTLEGKLSQRFITKRAAIGNSSYGNQIGCTTSYLREFYYEGYTAKRMELGAVVGAVKKSDVTRKSPEAGDIVVMLGAPTGRDGVGAATGSSKKEASDALENAFAQVQKGNASEERKIQRLFKKKEASKLIKKANDLGAGGVSVAIGELADGIDIFLENIYTKYAGLTPTELALSESQERMVVVLAKEDAHKFLELCQLEDLQAAHVATITDTNKLTMYYHDEIIVDIDRSFLDTNGVRQEISPIIKDSNVQTIFTSDKYLDSSFKDTISNIASDLNNADQSNLEQIFDNSGQRGVILSTYGGTKYRTLSEVSAQKIPTDGFTSTVSVLACGLNPALGEYQPFYAGAYSIVEAVSRLVASGIDYRKARLSLQEYFESVTNNPKAFGKPVATLLGALKAQRELALPALGGKDSMSGNFDDIKVPPTVAAFAIATNTADKVIGNDFKKANHYVYTILPKRSEQIDFNDLKNIYQTINELHVENKILSCASIKDSGLLAEVINMSYGNNIGIELNDSLSLEELVYPYYGGFVFETETKINDEKLILIGQTTKDTISYKNESLDIEEIYDISANTLSNVFYHYKLNDDKVEIIDSNNLLFKKHNLKTKAKVFVPVFYGTNNEYDLIKAAHHNQVDVESYQFNSLDYQAGLKQLAASIDECDILLLGNIAYNEDDLDGNTKYVYNTLKENEVKGAIERLIHRHGVIYGNGSSFKVLLELGLLTDGMYSDEIEATLGYNASFISEFVETQVVNNKNIFLDGYEGTFTLPYAGGYSGVVSNKAINKQQIISTINGNIEAMVSPNGLIMGRLCFSERYESGNFKNVYGNKQQDIIGNIIKYYLEK